MREHQGEFAAGAAVTLEQYQQQQHGDEKRHPVSEYDRQLAAHQASRKQPASTTPLLETYEILAQGACRGAGDVFFRPIEKEKPTERTEREEKAKAICRGCKVLELCKEDAILKQEIDGIRGGMTEIDLKIILGKPVRDRSTV